MVNLYYQDLLYENSYSLHEALLSAANKSIMGGGTYAFITSEGLKLLFEDSMFVKFFSQDKKFKLIVGIDEVTNTKTLEKLKELSNKYIENFEVKVFLHKDKNSLYHPKISWFKTSENKGILIVGSGNLTASGLRKNREIFNVIKLEEEQMLKIENDWAEWLESNTENLKELSDEEVEQKAKENSFFYRKKVSIEGKKEVKIESTGEAEPIIEEALETDEEENIEKETWIVYSDKNINQLYITEIPRASTRWNQVNFKKNAFTDYFGAKVESDEEYRVLFREVSVTSELGEVEVRPGVAVRSQNYRFELDAAKAKKYPQTGRPIGVFFKVATRMFIYTILMPGNLEYDIIRRYLDKKSQEPRLDRMKHYEGNLEEAKEKLKDFSMMQYVKEKNDRS